MKVLAVINPEDASEEEVARFATRDAARAVVFDKEGNVAVLNVSKRGYHKLPGGGIKPGEAVLDALKRECHEEIGCEIEIVGEVGEIVEYRKLFRQKNASFCYLANLVGEKGAPALEPDELEDGFKVIWLPIGKVIQLLATDRPEDKEAAWYMVPRDKIFLETAAGASG